MKDKDEEHIATKFPCQKCNLEGHLKLKSTEVRHDGYGLVEYYIVICEKCGEEQESLVTNSLYDLPIR